ncbi:hypothetical protein GCM10010307_65590 [Streptomyces vastus]|uniref:Uncharacterized protein n=1 Tax=Streptomyces vastus TaxID=285451 RepID=A0ABP6DYB1_9ACTN
MSQPRAPEKPKPATPGAPGKPGAPSKPGLRKGTRPGKARTPDYPQPPTGGRGRGPVRRMPVAQVLSQVTRTVYRHRAVCPACDGLTHRPTSPHPPPTQGARGCDISGSAAGRDKPPTHPHLTNRAPSGASSFRFRPPEAPART